MKEGTHILAKTGSSLTARLLGPLTLLAVVVVSAYLVRASGSHIGNVLAVFVVLAGFFALVPMIAETVVGKK